MITKILTIIVGTKNQRELKKLRPIVQKINDLEKSISKLSEQEVKDKTNEFRKRIAEGESLNSILPEAFALVREAGKRTLNMRHFDCQLIGGMVLNQGKIAEMKTGEGKTLVATLALYLNALTGKGAHLVTVNDYLAKRDAEWMQPIYNYLGMEVGIIQNNMGDEDRKKAYNADITYGTNSEFGFEYLRDNMKFNLNEYVQRDLNFVIVDEVDSILIDEARTPLIISGQAEKGSDFYIAANRAIINLQKDDDYELDEKARSVNLTDAGIDKVENLLNIKNLYAPENVLLNHHVQQALKANTLFKKDIEYVVRDNQVLIVDEFTGRILPGRRYSDGLHQAIEAKEGVKVERENQTLATITLQNYFRMYNKLSGMTGTAQTEAAEFHSIYKLDVISIPTNQPLIRRDEADIVFLSIKDKFNAVIKDIKDCHDRGQPALVGTASIEHSEYLSYLLNSTGIPHNVLNAKNHGKEAEIIQEAGEKGKITIATNMAGRGTDIKLGSGIVDLGGLRIIGTERHESRRIDNQLRGRAGRQGDPGSSKFYVALEDDLMRIFGGEKMKNRMMKLGMEEGESIEHSILSKGIAEAQKKVEKHNFDSRKNLLEYDDVLNQQRTVIYNYRREVLEGSKQIQALVRDMTASIVHNLFAIHCPKRQCSIDHAEEIIKVLHQLTNIPASEFEKIHFEHSQTVDFEEKVIDFLQYQHEQYRKLLPEDVVSGAEKWILLDTIDTAWKNHLLSMDHLKEGIFLRGYAQKNPLVEYKKESFFEFKNMMQQIKWDIVQRVFRLRPESISISSIHEIEKEKEKELSKIQIGGDETVSATSRTVHRDQPKVGRNSPCPCGSGKKFKHCCGKN